jgi:osmoprotectant transport system substrate-binding protein
LRQYPQIAAIVKPLMESFDRENLQRLNARVQINGEWDAAVAAEYLRTKGWLK